MTYNCALADMIARIKNAQLVKKKYVILFFSTMVCKILQILLNNGYILKVEELQHSKNIIKLKVMLKYQGMGYIPRITNINIISKPSRRIFVPYSKLNFLLRKTGIVILSTSKGIITCNKAIYLRVGGEVLCNIF